MLYYALSNSKGKHCINNVIMCMSILVDRGPVVYIIDNYYYFNGTFAFFAYQENFAKQNCTRKSRNVFLVPRSQPRIS